MKTEQIENQTRIAIDRLTGKPFAARDDSDVGMLADICTADELANLDLFTQDELDTARRLRVPPSSLRGGG